MPVPSENPFDNSGGSNAGIPVWEGPAGKAAWARAAVLTLATPPAGDEDWTAEVVSEDKPVPVMIVSDASGRDLELVTVAYRCKTAFTGAAVGALITATRVLNTSADPVVQVGSTLWRNESTDAALGSAPAAVNLEVVGLGALTDAQLRATAIAISATALPLPAGAATETTAAALLAAIQLLAPASGVIAVTPHDTNALANVRALKIGGAGNVVVTVGGVDATFTCSAGELLNVRATKVKLTGTTATGIVALT